MIIIEGNIKYNEKSNILNNFVFHFISTCSQRSKTNKLISFIN